MAFTLGQEDPTAFSFPGKGKYTYIIKPVHVPFMKCKMSVI